VYKTATFLICLQVSLGNKSYKSDNYNEQKSAWFYSLRHAIVIIGHSGGVPLKDAWARIEAHGREL